MVVNYDSVINGGNAFFDMRGNRIFINLDKMAWPLPHEMGHAINKTISRLGKILNKMKVPGVILSSLAFYSALLKRKKVEGEEPNGMFDKITTFFKNNCGKLTFLGFLPVIAEEALASKNGLKEIKATSPEHILKLLKTGNKSAWLTYLGIGLCSTAVAVVASKVRDAIAKPKEIKQ